MTSYRQKKIVPISCVVIAKDDLFNFAKIIYDRYERDLNTWNGSDVESRLNRGRISYTIEIFLDNGSEHDYDDLSSYTEENLFERDSVSKARIRYYGINKRIEFVISKVISPSNYENTIEIIGDNLEWVNALYTEFQDTIRRIKPQTDFFRKYGSSLNLLFALLIGYSIFKIFIYLMSIVYGLQPINASYDIQYKPLLTSIYSILFFAAIVIVGSIPSAKLVDYLKSLYPCVELVSGPEHMQVEARRRERFFQVILIFGVPILISVLTGLLL